MKIDKKNLKHWIVLFQASLFLGIGIVARLILGKEKRRVVLYGHRLNGNLLPLYNHWSDREGLEVFFITLDAGVYEQLQREGKQVLLATKLSDAITIARTSVFVSDHGLHHFVILRQSTNAKFIHVLHGIPYKGYDAEDFKHLHGHDQIWVSSEELARMHVDKFGFKQDQVKVTGFARTEATISYMKVAESIKRKYHIDTDKKTVLIAPTWKQDDKGRSIIPFGSTLEELTNAITELSDKNDIQVIFRSHLNEKSPEVVKKKNVYFMPYSKYPVAEEFLAISDVLITDWSSIGFDFLVTGRPIIYLDVKLPFKKGNSVDQRFRPGAKAGSLESLSSATKQALYSPGMYLKKHREIINETTELVFGLTLDGKILKRADVLLDGLMEGKAQ